MLLLCQTGLLRLFSTHAKLNTYQHSENDNVQTMRKMDDLHFVDFVEVQRKSKDDFNAAHDIVLSAGLGDYAKKIHYFSAW